MISFVLFIFHQKIVKGESIGKPCFGYIKHNNSEGK